MCFVHTPLKIQGGGASISLKQNLSIASFQHGVLESRPTWMFPDASLQNLDAGYLCRHDEDLYFHVLWASVRS